jgi:hypothetical protein
VELLGQICLGLFHRTPIDNSSLNGLVGIKKWNLNLIDNQLQEQENMDPYAIFVYGIRSPYSKESYFRLLRIFFTAIDLGKGKTFDERCNSFIHKQDRILTGHLVISLDSCIFKKKEVKRRSQQQ